MKNNFHHIAPTESASTVYGRVRSNLVALLRSHYSPASFPVFGMTGCTLTAIKLLDKSSVL